MISRLIIGVSLAAVLLSAFACSKLFPPPLEDQKRHIDAGQFRSAILERRAFLELWGTPTYTHVEATHFFVAPDGRYVPEFRVSLGEAPAGWDGSAVFADAVFLGYPERGELLGFIDERLVSREQLSTDAIHAIAKKWQYEGQFKTRLEAPSKP
ncbi:MAG TPA: hypothetical protein VFA38_11430 [Nitrospirales bacterium]|nr:hypothetical protein [Nitrospirales bacterium]